MAFGLQVFNADGSVDFDSSESGVMRVAQRVRVTGSFSFTSRVSPPFKVLVIADTPGFSMITPIKISVVGIVVNVEYKPYMYGRGVVTVNKPATILVCL